MRINFYDVRLLLTAGGANKESADAMVQLLIEQRNDAYEAAQRLIKNALTESASARQMTAVDFGNKIVETLGRLKKDSL